MLLQLLACPHCGATCDPADGVACLACGAYVRDAPPAIFEPERVALVAPAAPVESEPVVVERAAPAAGPADLLPRGWHRTARGGRRLAVTLTVLAVGVNAVLWWQLAAPNDDPRLGEAIVEDGIAQVGDAQQADRPDGRPEGRAVSGIAEGTLVEVWAPIADLYADSGDYSRVTAAALGEAQPHIGIVAADRPPAREDEVSLRVGDDVFVILGTRTSATSTCTWLRDNGAGPQVAEVANASDCSANAAPVVGWEPIAP